MDVIPRPAMRTGRIALLLATWIAFPAMPQDAGTPVVDVPSVERRTIELANDKRREHKVDAVRANEKLSVAAREFARWIAEHDRLDHEADGSTPPQRAERQGYAYCIITENLAFQFASSGFSTDALAKRFVDGWMNSPPHRRNLLDGDVTETGVGVAQSKATARWYGVQMFGLPASAKMSFDVTNGGSEMARYRVGDRLFTLAPRVTRTHQRCRSSELVLEDGDGASARVEPKGGETFVVTRNSEGKWRLTRKPAQ